MKGQYIQINGAKLHAELKQRKLTASEVSAEMGYNPYFLTKSIKLERLCVPAVMMLEKMYNIKREDYEVKPAPEPEPAPVQPDAPPVDRRLWQMTGDDLYRVIFAALVAANN